MKPKEFKIGNYIECYGKVCEITCIGIEGVSAKYDGENGKCSVKFINPTLEPIKLTEEWLENFGANVYFTSDPQERHASKAFEFGNLKIHMCDEDVEEFIFEASEFIQIKYVHQLQNLYYSIMNQPIIIK